MGVFLITLAFVLAFLPGMLDPFTTSSGEPTVVAERGADRLAEELLAESLTAPNRLNETCTAEFFDGDGATGSCRFPADSDDVPSALGVDNRFQFNVTVQRNGTIRSTNGVTLKAGRSPPSDASMIIAKRMVLLEGTEGILYVRVW